MCCDRSYYYLLNGSSDKEVHSMLMRLMDFLKVNGITSVFVSLTSGSSNLEQTTVGIFVDRYVDFTARCRIERRTQPLHLCPSSHAECTHSNQLREFVLTADGIKLLPVYVGPAES